MTIGERLIRNLCKETREQIQAVARTTRDALTAELPLTGLPVPLRRHAKMIVELKQRLKAAQAHFKNSGYHIDDNGGITRDYQTRQRLEAHVYKQRDRREAQVKALETRAIVDTLSLAGAPLQARLHRLQDDLTKI